MKKQSDPVEWTELLFIPLGLVLSYLFSRWLPSALAISLSVVLLSLAFYIFKPKKGGLKRFILATLLGGMIVYGLTAFFGWPP